MTEKIERYDVKKSDAYFKRYQELATQSDAMGRAVMDAISTHVDKAEMKRLLNAQMRLKVARTKAYKAWTHQVDLLEAEVAQELKPVEAEHEPAS